MQEPKKLVSGWLSQELDAAFQEMETMREIQADPTVLDRVRKAIESCEGEQEHFEAWARKRGYDMTEHPLHYLFLDHETYHARQGWKAALEYVERVLAGDRA